MLLYTKDHTWVLTEGNAREGRASRISRRRSSGDIAYVELPAAGQAPRARRGGVHGGFPEILERDLRPGLGDRGRGERASWRPRRSCALVNSDPLGEGWLIVLEMGDPGELQHLLVGKGIRGLHPGRTDASPAPKQPEARLSASPTAYGPLTADPRFLRGAP